MDERRQVPSVSGYIAALCVALGLASCGGGSPTTPTSGNHNPTISSISVTPAFGVSGLTTFTMNASASDQDGDAVTYRWSFGSGSATGASASSVITGDGSVPVQLTVTDSKGATASDSRSVTIGTMTGSWSAAVLPCGNFNLTLTQTGGAVSGSFVMPSTWCNVPAGSTGTTDPADPGTIDANGNVQIRLKQGIFLDAVFRGTMDSSGRKITGGMFNSGFSGQTTTLTKQ